MTEREFLAVVFRGRLCLHVLDLLKIRRRLPILAVAFLLTACGGEEERARADGAVLRGAELVAGTALERYGLLVIPREGGIPHLRAPEDPGSSLWSGRTELPSAAEVHALGESVVLKSAGGEIFRYDPARDRLEELGRLSAGATWLGSGTGGVWLDAEPPAFLAVFRESTWRHELPGSALWASVVEEGVVLVLMEAEGGPELRLLRQGEETPEKEAAVSVTPPGLVTAWGRRAIFVGADGRRLVLLGLPQLLQALEIELEGAVGFLGISPSTHQLYVALTSDPRLLAVNRFSGRTRELARLDRPAVEIRSPPLGSDRLLAHDGSRAYSVPLTGGGAVGLDVEWRPDLPLILPDGRILAVREDEVRLLADGGPAAGEVLDAPAEASWVPVRWRPAPPPVIAARPGPSEEAAPAARLDETEAEVAGLPEPEAEAEAEAATGEDPPAGVEREDRVRPEEPDPERDRAVEVGGLPAGVYAIVSSSQRLPGVADLSRTLTGAGFTARVQRHRDEAGEIWYRCMVGPFGSREEAEEGADRLRAERGLHAWITEIAPDTMPADIDGV